LTASSRTLHPGKLTRWTGAGRQTQGDTIFLLSYKFIQPFVQKLWHILYPSIITFTFDLKTSQQVTCDNTTSVPVVGF